MVRSFMKLWFHATATTLAIYVGALTVYLVVWEVLGP